MKFDFFTRQELKFTDYKTCQFIVAFKIPVYYICIMTKTEIRKKILQIRNNISDEFCNVKSGRISGNFKKYVFPSLPKGKIIIYNSFKNEVKTNIIINFLINKRYEIYNPCIINGRIIPCRLYSQKQLSPGLYGIMEPIKKHRIKSMQNLNAIIIPGIAFDKAGNRIGFGKGYFDEFLGKLNKNILKIGLAFSFQILNKIPATKNDVKMDVIITDEEIIYANKKKKHI